MAPPVAFGQISGRSAVEVNGPATASRQVRGCCSYISGRWPASARWWAVVGVLSGVFIDTGLRKIYNLVCCDAS